jgi:hypothetical protein
MRIDQWAPRRGDRSEQVGLDLPASRSKNGRQRVTPIAGLAREMVEQRLSGVEKGPLFLLEKGVVVTSAHVGHYLLTRRTALPIGVFTSHDLRRTFATMLAEMGVALDMVAAIVGHESGGKDTRTLVRHYVHTERLSARRRRSARGTSGSRASCLAKSAKKWCGCCPALGDLLSNKPRLANPAAFSRRLRPLRGPLTAKSWSASHTEIAGHSDMRLLRSRLKLRK